MVETINDVCSDERGTHLPALQSAHDTSETRFGIPARFLLPLSVRILMKSMLCIALSSSSADFVGWGSQAPPPWPRPAAPRPGALPTRARSLLTGLVLSVRVAPQGSWPCGWFCSSRAVFQPSRQSCSLLHHHARRPRLWPARLAARVPRTLAVT